MFSKELLDQLQQKIESSTEIAIYWHQNIDPDAIWSILGFGRILEKLWKKVTYFTSKSVNDWLKWVPGWEKIQIINDITKRYDLMLFCDFTWYERIPLLTQWFEEYYDSHYKIAIDHHIEHDTQEQLKLVDDTMSSNCEILLEICQELYPELIDKEIATYFYIGFAWDTGNLRHEKNSIQAFEHWLDMLRYWVDKKSIVDQMWKISRSAFKVSQTVLSRTKNHHWIVYTYMMESDLTDHGLSSAKDLDVLWTLKSIEWWKICIFFKQVWDILWLSFRSLDTNVQKIASSYGGWGHIYAAGCEFLREWDLLEQIQWIVEKIEKMI